ncbi:Sec23/Sec24 trunk domain-containing protein [Cryptosporidium muris RN66]|uniref:Protein transport protein SEC23 n=1 Tax=Cryptosporidium muris (strain RN66) TaxID=441375 RepID=B6AGG3_CRYMR|nr:Sec23/Sec24 trunk domain-containing protein [Cryptosporidium muris RN66]EEA07304.1 Sec23/Sec24 trunk domain-containing protein [Cryptosporidium muris RN66]|eukprot:XP_002141653.1 Sec23/Sec24 trunk domain-containing protein [Cryptosporidium muris RN66]
MDYQEQENQTGVRFNWNIWPSTKLEATRIELPLGCLFTPLKDTSRLQLVEYEPVRCRASGCILNPYCPIDFRSKVWTCPFSLQRIPFPPHYAEHISENVLPAELMHPSIEYILPATPGNTSNPPVFVFVIDTCLIEAELNELRDSIQQVISLMPPDALVGLITFGTVCCVHELGFSECPKSYVFRGTKDVTAQQVQVQLGLTTRHDPRYSSNPVSIHSFLLPVPECEFALTSILEDLRPDSWPIPTDNRPQRCTGAALTVATGLMEACCIQQSGRIMLFVGGVCTIGPGTIVSPPLAESIRHHLDLQKNSNAARHVQKAIKFYASLAHRAVQNGHAVDIFACSLDQVGLYEMRVLCDRSGGNMVMSDSFSMNIFRDSFKKIFEPDNTGYIKQAFNGRVELLCSKDIKVCGAIGACTGTGKKGSQVGDSLIGESNTCEWSFGALDKNTTIAFYFEVVAQSVTQIPPGKQSFIQFQTLYNHPSGRRRLRVTTVSYRYSEPNLLDLAPGFDQEAAAVLMARLAVVRTESEDSLDVLRWLDRKLIRLKSFSSDFNASPDETAYYRTVLLRENVMNSLVMIQPALLQYSFDEGPPQPVLLDVQSLKPNVILLLDSFFHVVVWYGEMIYQWKEQGYHENPEYENFRNLLLAPAEDTKAILQDRFPVPKFVLCHAGGSQARFLLAKVNPSATHNTLSGATFDSVSDGSIVITDDVSLKVFMEHLIKLAVQS